MKEYSTIMGGIITTIILVILSFSILASLGFRSYLNIKTDTAKTSIMLETAIGYEKSLNRYREVLEKIDEIK